MALIKNWYANNILPKMQCSRSTTKVLCPVVSTGLSRTMKSSTCSNLLLASKAFLDSCFCLACSSRDKFLKISTAPYLLCNCCWQVSNSVFRLSISCWCPGIKWNTVKYSFQKTHSHANKWSKKNHIGTMASYQEYMVGTETWLILVRL